MFVSFMIINIFGNAISMKPCKGEDSRMELLWKRKQGRPNLTHSLRRSAHSGSASMLLRTEAAHRGSAQMVLFRPPDGTTA